MQADTFDHIVRRERSVILNYINASVRDRDLAEDLTQECFWRASQGWTEFRGAASVHTWLRHIAMNIIRNFVRKKNLQVFRWAVPVDAELEASLVDHSQVSPEVIAIFRESVTRIWAAADAISPKQRVALRLRFKADLELAEIATAMGITEGSVKVHLFRAVQSIRATLQECEL